MNPQDEHLGWFPTNPLMAIFFVLAALTVLGVFARLLVRAVVWTALLIRDAAVAFYRTF